MEQFVLVTDGEKRIEFPAEPDGSLLLQMLSSQFDTACGLQYHNAATDSVRAVRLCDGRFCPPTANGWGSTVYIAVFPGSVLHKIPTVT